MQSFQELYDRLNPQQKQAVDTIDGPVFVMAGPGTGKTQILTLRIANILKQTDVEPENILALTFTNTAAYNMRERLATITGPEAAHRVYISTFHAFAEDMMKRYQDLFDTPFGSRLISPVEQIELIETIADSHGTHYFSVFKRRESTLRSIVFALGKIKEEGMTPDEFRTHTIETFERDMASDDIRYKRVYKEFKAGDIKPGEQRKLEERKNKNLELADIYEEYQQQLRSQGLYDFDDVIIRFVHELGKPDSVLKAELQEQFQYILVDEHQDTNDAQNTIIQHLIDNPVSEGKPNLFVVGDRKQAIFRFAGASEESYTRLLGLVSDPVIINLTENYRSHQEVLEHAHEVITSSPHHSDEALLKAFFDHNGVVEYREFNDHKMEVLWLAQDIKSRIENGENPNEIAVLYRNNADAEDIRRIFDVYSIRYKDFSKKNILKDSDLQKLFYLLRTVHDPSDNEALAKTLFIDFLGFDVFDVERILQKSRNARGDYHSAIMTILETPEKLQEAGILEERLPRYAEFVDMIKNQKQQSEATDALGFFSDFVRESGCLTYLLSQQQSVLAIHKLEKLFDEIKKETSGRESFVLDDLITYLNTMKQHGITMNITNTLSDGVNLLTFHGSKGLEFDTVYVVKALAKKKVARDITLPFDEFSDGDIEDERRLFYVALTRTRKNCFVSSYVYDEEGREKNRSLHINEMESVSHIDMSSWEKEHTENVADFFGQSQEHIVSLIDPDYVREQFLSNTLSVSALNNYVESPLKYFFRNLVHLPEARSPFLEFGNVVHETLEHYFNTCIDAHAIQGKDVLESSFALVLSRNHTYEEYRERAWGVLSNYFDNQHTDFVVPTYTEKRIPVIPFELDNGITIKLTGVVDKITMNDKGEIIVWDYKTGKTYSDMDKDRKAKTKRQAAFYKLLLQQAFDGKYNFHTAVFDFIEPNTKGEYEQARFEIDQSDVDEVRVLINELAERVLDGTLLDGDVYKDSTNRELLEFLEVLRGPRTKEQLNLFEK
ncbi:ATP-dependent helicase [Patescibacteria group bacterium]|nr:ATP-dependent helicase [Patescibacteria group bacterium]